MYFAAVVLEFVPRKNIVDRLEHDIALIRLDTRVDIDNNANANVICLPRPGVRIDDNDCAVAGWGYTGNTYLIYRSI